jgi:GGDEF domain-containing protein
MMDVDHFKKFNDTYGHDTGDQVLRMVASRVRDVGGGGRPYRYGGEEFSVVFPGKTAESVMGELQGVRKAIETMPFHVRKETRPRSDKAGKKSREGQQGKKVQITISIGVAGPDDRRETPEQVIKRADEALYRAKEGGRNQVAT